MNRFGYHRTNIRPVSSDYSVDSDIHFNNKNVHTKDGLDFTFNDGLSSIEDSTVNNFNYLFLTKPLPYNNLVTLEKNEYEYPFYRTSWIKVADEDKFLTLDFTSGFTILSGASATVSSNNIFDIEFIDPFHLSISHRVGDNIKFLTLNQSNSSQLTFESRSVAAVGTQDTQIFNYVVESDIITLSQNLSTLPTPGATSKRFPMMLAGMTSISGAISARELLTSYSSLFRPISTSDNGQGATGFKIRPSTSPTKSFDLRETYFVYASSINPNDLSVDESKSISNIKNNYIVHTATENIDLTGNSIDTNLFPLKNQITLEGEQSKNNPYTNQEDDVTHREYHKLHTGTKQKYGYDNINLSYTTGTKQIEFTSDKLTYFHVPRILHPYTQININDSTLVKSGATPGNSPAISDKVFKKRTSDDSSSVPIDPSNGSFLCAWLSGNSNPNTTPIWVDRYYNSSYATKATALTAGVLEPVPYFDTHDVLTRHTGASAMRAAFFDKLSDIVFEPGILYAYHHVGKGNAQKLIYSLKGSIVTQELEIYNDFNKNKLLPNFDTSEKTHIDDQGNVASGSFANPAAIEVPVLYEFNRDNYGIMSSVDHAGSFSLNFWLWSKDWNKNLGYNILGNYLTKGFSILNNDFVTPFIAIPDGQRVHIYNTNFDLIASHVIGKNIKLFSKRGNLENYWIVDDNNVIYEYNINGVIVDRITSSLLTGKELIDLELSEDALYILTKTTTSTNGSDAQYFKYEYHKASSDANYVGELKTNAIWNFKNYPDSTATNLISSGRIHVVSKGLSGGEGVLITQQDALSSNTSDYNLLSGTYIFTNNSTVDNDGKPWVLQQGKIYSYSSLLSSNIAAVSASNIIEGVNIDKDNNVWVLHDYDKVTKLNNAREVLFTTSLETLVPLSAVRHNRSIDYICEFDESGYTSYPVVFTQSASGARMYKIDPNDGTVLADTISLTGTDAPVRTFATSPSGIKTYTGHDFIRKNRLETGNKLKAKVSLSSPYNTSTTTQSYSSYTLAYELSGLTQGWHNFNIQLDAEKGLYELYIDSAKIQTISLSGGKFSYSDIFDSPLIVGAAPFYTKLILQDHLDQPRHYLANDIKLKNIKLYNKPLNEYEIKNHYMVLQNSNSIKWDIPVGQRNYVDTVERIFKHSLPGRKSNFVDINIRNTEITDSNLIDELKQNIIDELNVPVHTSVNNIGWDNNFGSTVNVSADRKLPSTIFVPNDLPTSTTPNLTGVVITNVD